MINFAEKYRILLRRIFQPRFSPAGGCRAGGAAWETSDTYTREGLVDVNRLTHGLQNKGGARGLHSSATVAATAAASDECSQAAALLSRPRLERLLTAGADDRTNMQPNNDFNNI